MDLELPENLGLVKLPTDLQLSAEEQVAAYLLKAELKNRRFVEQLEQLGFDAGHYSFDFGTLILILVGIEGKGDEVYDWYHQKLDAYIQQGSFKDDDSTLTNQALDFLMEIKKMQ